MSRSRQIPDCLTLLEAAAMELHLQVELPTDVLLKYTDNVSRARHPEPATELGHWGGHRELGAGARHREAGEEVQQTDDGAGWGGHAEGAQEEVKEGEEMNINHKSWVNKDRSP